MGIYKLAHAYTFGGQGMVNIYHYLSAGVLADGSQSLAEAFTDLILPAVRAIQSVNVVHNYVHAEDLDFLGTDEYTIGFSGLTGMRSGDSYPPHDTMTFKLSGKSGVTRAGRKAIGGVPESDFTQGLPGGVMPGLLADLAALLAASIDDGATLPFFIPVIYGVRDLWLDVVNPVSFASFSRVSTQNSRKAYTSSTLPATRYAPNYSFTENGVEELPELGSWAAGAVYADGDIVGLTLPALYGGRNPNTAELPSL